MVTIAMPPSNTKQPPALGPPEFTLKEHTGEKPEWPAQKVLKPQASKVKKPGLETITPTASCRPATTAKW